MRFKTKILIVFKLFISFFLINLIFSCAGSPVNYSGAWVKEENRISLMEGGLHQGQWKTRDLSIDYQYRQAEENLQISGVVELARYIQNGYTVLDHLYLYVYFLEADGTVLDTKAIQTFGYRQWFVVLKNMSFDNRLELPQGAVALSFGYRGKVSEGGGGPGVGRRGERIEWDFWETPRRKPPE